MVERRPLADLLTHVLLAAGAALLLLPVWLAFVASTLTAEQVLDAPMPLLPGERAWQNYAAVLTGGSAPLRLLLLNSAICALVIAAGKIAISVLSAFAVVYFRFPGRALCFWLIFVTLMLPVEVRILPTFEVVAGLGLLDSYAGLTVPLLASATATFLFRQFFLTLPDELADAARIDGAGPLRFLWSILLPLSRTQIAALFVILFIYGWNQYLWPLMVTTREDYYTAVIGIKRMISGGDAATEWNLVMATALVAMLPPALVVLAMQKWFVRGLVETEK
ncbi:MAG: sn-glycerol-3-phosphate ABC transporter permease UgpE [Burkholderiales bacterium]|nr:sn-glycerol-3-phosphate ABC transporter permease UgpE [Burkholderiales bacterium]